MLHEDIVDTLDAKMRLASPLENLYINRLPYCKNSFCDRFHRLYT